MFVHGLYGTPLHRVWRGMIQRCRDPGCASYPRYGGRGIAVCDRWLSVVAFVEDMGATYRTGLEIGRIDNDGPYSPDNCEWQTRRTNMLNTHATRWLDTPVGRMPLVVAAEHYRLSKRTLTSRLQAGWSVEQACTTAPIPNKGREVSQDVRAKQAVAQARRYTDPAQASLLKAAGALGRAKSISDPAILARRNESIRRAWARRKGVET